MNNNILNVLQPLIDFRYGISDRNNNKIKLKNDYQVINILYGGYANNFRDPEIILNTKFGTCLELALTIKHLFNNVGRILIIYKCHAIFYIPDLGGFNYNPCVQSKLKIELLTDKELETWFEYNDVDNLSNVKNRNEVFRLPKELIEIKK